MRAGRSLTSILFITPPHIPFASYTRPAGNVRHILKKDGRHYAHLISDMPLGILSLSAYVKQYSTHPVVTRLLDFNVELNELEAFTHAAFAPFFHEQLARDVPGFAPDIIAISSLFAPSYQNMLDCAAECRTLFPAALIVAGGNVPSILYREIFQASRCFDGLCFGEGEKPLLALIEASDRKAFLEQHPSWITPAKNQARFQPAHDFIDNLDAIPFFDYALCDTEKYSKYPAVSAYGGVRERQANFYLMSSRGCPFKCIFCAAHKVHGRSVRFHSVQRVREDLLRLRHDFDATIIVFQDDHFMADVQRALEIIHFVQQESIPAFFQNLAIYALSRTVLEALARAGTTHLNLSIESGSERVLKHVMHKPLKLAKVKQVVDDCRALGIYTAGSILIGLPGETKDDIAEARAVLKTLGVNWYVIFCASPLIGSELYDVCKEKGYLKDGHLGSDYSTAVVETEEFSAQYIQEMAYLLNLELNFVENSDFRLGHYQTALIGFENAIRAKNDHGLAFHFASQCYSQLNNIEKSNEYRARAQQIYQESDYWRGFFQRFNLQP